jgi:hypothetical protein
MPKKMMISVRSNESGSCPLCGESLGGIDDFDGACNHDMEHAGFELQHVGNETRFDGATLRVATFVGNRPRGKVLLTREQMRRQAMAAVERGRSG